jgi:hypothetical protein
MWVVAGGGGEADCGDLGLGEYGEGEDGVVGGAGVPLECAKSVAWSGCSTFDGRLAAGYK